MSALTVLYDDGCGLCRSVREWLEDEPQYVPLHFVAANSPEAHSTFPDLNHSATLDEITVVGDDGAVYRGEGAWLICLWALRGYREWSMRLATPALRPAVRRFVLWVSTHRLSLSGAACGDDECQL